VFLEGSTVPARMAGGQLMYFWRSDDSSAPCDRRTAAAMDLLHHEHTIRQSTVPETRERFLLPFECYNQDNLWPTAGVGGNGDGGTVLQWYRGHNY
jgi:hypothetical protein